MCENIEVKLFDRCLKNAIPQLDVYNLCLRLLYSGNNPLRKTEAARQEIVSGEGFIFPHSGSVQQSLVSRRGL